MFPRMFAAFDLPHPPRARSSIVNETDDGSPYSSASLGVRRLGGVVAVGDRIWAETSSTCADPRRRPAAYRLAARERAAKDQVRRGAHGDRARDCGRRAHDGRDGAARRARRIDGGARRGRRARAAPGRLALPLVHDAHLHRVREGDFDSDSATARDRCREGTSVMFDFGGVVDGYCSDFGRTIYCGDPPPDYLEAYGAMLAA